MPTLYLLRHAKSSWDDPVADRDRPLAPRGERAAKHLAEHIRQRRLRPAIVLCSPAARAQATLELIRAALGRKADVRIDERLYGAGAGELLAIITATPSSAESLLLVGHNPAMHDLTLGLTGDGDDAALAHVEIALQLGDDLVALRGLDRCAAGARLPGEPHLAARADFARRGTTTSVRAGVGNDCSASHSVRASARSGRLYR